MEEKLDLILSEIAIIKDKVEKTDELVSKVDGMETKVDKIDGLINKVDGMETKVDKIDGLIIKVNSMEAKMGNMESDINSIKTNITTMKTDIKGLKKDVKQLQKNDDYMFDAIKDLRSRTGRTEEKIDNLTKITDIYGTRLTNQGQKIDINIRDRIDKTNDEMNNLYQESKNDREELHKQVNELSKIIMA